MRRGLSVGRGGDHPVCAADALSEKVSHNPTLRRHHQKLHARVVEDATKTAEFSLGHLAHLCSLSKVGRGIVAPDAHDVAAIGKG
jgi:hypothetical protein